MDPLALLILHELLRLRIGAAWRWLLIGLGIRRITPARGERLPDRLAIVPAIGDTGGQYRPKHRPQDPAKDPDEPYGSESSGTGSDHGWSNCTMSSGADALAYQTAGELTPWGGRLRHKQGDLSGGTDLYDLRDAWASYGETLSIRSGQGWSGVVKAHDEGRAIVIQGTGEVPGSGSFTGGHACAIGLGENANGAWLFGDPLASDWQWISPGSIRSWAERWQSSIAFAVSRIVAADEPPDPPDPPPAPPPAPGPTIYAAQLERDVELAEVRAVDELVDPWLAWLRAPVPGPADLWDAGAWADPELELEELVDGEPVDPCEPGAPASWARGRIPTPAAEALDALLVPASWDGPAWRAGAWL